MNIDRFARWYRWVEYAAFGRALERGRFLHLDRLNRVGRILVAGEGDGRALRRLAAVAEDARIDVLEISAEMIQLARRCNGDSDRVLFRQENALNAWLPDGYYDGVVTFFFLDCFTEDEARGLIRRIAGATTPGAVWLVSEFGIPERGWRRWHAIVWIRAMYLFFGVVSGLKIRALPPVEALLREAGLRPLAREEDRWGLIRSEVWRRPG